MSRRLNSYLFWLFLGICIFAFFNRNSARNVKDIFPEVLKSPILTKASGQQFPELVSRGFNYTLIPVSECEISGLIVDIISHGPVTFKMVENGLPMNRNLTLIWGSNVTGKTYRNKDIKFSDGSVQWEGGASVNLDELARVALITKDPRMWSRIKGLSGGDQVTIAGTLVNARADRIKPVNYCTNHMEWDTGMPGHNDRFWSIYVQDIRILKKANVFLKFLFWASICGVIATVVIRFRNPISYS